MHHPGQYPKKGEEIHLRFENGWTKAKVIGRGAKATSAKLKDYFNVQYKNEEKGGVSLDRVEWQREDPNNMEEANLVLIPVKEHHKPE